MNTQFHSNEMIWHNTVFIMIINWSFITIVLIMFNENGFFLSRKYTLTPCFIVRPKVNGNVVYAFNTSKVHPPGGASSVIGRNCTLAPKSTKIRFSTIHSIASVKSCFLGVVKNICVLHESWFVQC